MDIEAFFLVSLLGDDLFENFWVFVGDDGKDFSVQTNLLLVKTADDFAVASSELLCSCTDADLLDSAVITLLQLAIAVGVDASFESGCLCKGELGFASPHHALCSGEDVLSAFDVVCTTFDSWHIQFVIMWGIRKRSTF